MVRVGVAGQMFTQAHGHHASVRFGCLTVFPRAATLVSVSATLAVLAGQVLDELHRPQISRYPVHTIVELQHSACTEACAVFSLVQLPKGQISQTSSLQCFHSTRISALFRYSCAITALGNHSDLTVPRQSEILFMQWLPRLTACEQGFVLHFVF